MPLVFLLWANLHGAVVIGGVVVAAVVVTALVWERARLRSLCGWGALAAGAGSIAASRIAREFHFGGPSFTIAAEENSGVRALEVAVRALQRGELDQALGRPQDGDALGVRQPPPVALCNLRRD